MPHIRIRSISAEKVQEMSTAISREISLALSVPEEHVTCEHIASQFFFRGKPSKIDPFVEFLGFSKEQETQDICAEILCRIVQQATQETDVTVVFYSLNPAAYYENAKHY